ncbi:MAG: DUF4340 domain-containing protein [Planctomycetes bacterium]|nr:DUF4340 domain-containing protein [Planctomycetota bacterium]
MNDFAKTGIAAAAAVGTVLLALSMGPREVSLELFDDQGQEFFAGFTDPTSVATLEVVEFREAAGAAYPFVVQRDAKGRWTIPSHGGYPADAKDRMGKAAAMMIGLKKQVVVGDVPGRHVEFGVVDPLDAGTETAGRGTRVTMKDGAGNVLADLIVGKEVDGKLGEHYVRVPDKKRVYRTKLDGELSTKFADWIETDLLKATSWDIQKVTFDNYSVDEQRGEVVPGDKYVVSKSSDNKWTFAGLDPEKEEANEDKLREFANTLGQIKIVGVRQKPEGLTAMLEQATGIDRQILAQTLAQKGFFLGRGGKLFSNEGDLLFETSKGVRYTLRFGELVAGEGEEVSSGIGSAAKPADDKQDPNAKPADKPANNRYLMVTAEFDPALLTEPAGVRLPKEQMEKRAEARRAIEEIAAAVATWKNRHEGKLPATLAELTVKPADGEPVLKALNQDPWGSDYVLLVEGDDFTVASYADDKKEGGEGVAADVRSDRIAYEEALQREAQAWDDHNKKVEDGRAEADKLMQRFGPWYYVIDRALFEQLKPKREDLVKPKAPKPADPAAPVAPGEDGK